MEDQNQILDNPGEPENLDYRCEHEIIDLGVLEDTPSRRDTKFIIKLKADLALLKQQLHRVNEKIADNTEKITQKSNENNELRKLIDLFYSENEDVLSSSASCNRSLKCIIS